MNFKIAIVGASLMAFSGIVAMGCGNACEDATTAESEKLASCPTPPKAVTTTTSGAATTCTDAAGTLLTCQAKAFTAAPCDCINGGDITKCTPAQAKSFTDAFTACSAPAK